MKLFKSEKLESINNKITEINGRQAAIQAELADLYEEQKEVIEGYAIGMKSEHEVDKMEDKIEAKKKEIVALDELKSKIKTVKRQAVTESLPFVKEARQKRVQAIQKEYDAKVKKVHEARFAFLQELSELGAIRSKVGSLNSDYNQDLIELGMNPETYGAALNETVVISAGITADKDSLGVKESVQKRIYNGESNLLNGYNVGGEK